MEKKRRIKRAFIFLVFSIFFISLVLGEKAHVVMSDDTNFAFMENDGTGKFTPAYVQRTTITLPHEVAAGDFDEDGIWDGAVNHWQDGKFSVFWGSFVDGKRTFKEQVYDISQVLREHGCRGGGVCPGQMHAIGSGDFDEDGDIDLALVDNENNAMTSVVIAFSDGKGSRSFSGFERYEMPNNWNARIIEVNDFNGDNHLDFIVPEAGGDTYYIFFNNKDNILGKFNVEERKGGGRLHFIESGDIDNDGDNDLAFADSLYIYLMKNDGAGQFSKTDSFCIKDSQGICTTPDFYSVELSDLNKDGFLDIAALRPDGLFVWIWDGTKFKGAPNQRRAASLSNAIDMETVDVNADGFKDIIVGNPSTSGSGVAVFKIGEDPQNPGALMISPMEFFSSKRNTDTSSQVMIDVYYEKDDVKFIRGDVDNSGTLDLTDAVYLLSYLFQGGMVPKCLDAADVDDTGIVDLADVIYLLNRLFMGGAAIPPPNSLGGDSTSDGLDCKCYGQGC